MKSSILVLLLLIRFSYIAVPEEIDVMFNRDFYPFEFVNDDGIADGFAVDLIFAVAREAALGVNMIGGNWKFRENLLFNGEIDLSPGYLLTSENPSIIESKPLFLVPFSLLYKKQYTISDSNPLKTSTVVFSSGDSSELLLTDKQFSEKVIRTKSWSDSVKALLAGYGDYTILSNVHYALLERDSRNNLKELNNFSLKLPYGFYSARWNSNTLEKLNNGISIIKASGEYDRIYKKWFGNSENLIIKRSDSRQSTNIYITVAVLLIAVFIFFRNKRKVKK